MYLHVSFKMQKLTKPFEICLVADYSPTVSSHPFGVGVGGSQTVVKINELKF